MLVEVPVQKTLFRVLPATLQAGREIGVCAVLFTQGVNELQSLADTCVTCTGMYLPLPRFLPNYQSTHMYQLLTHACIPSQYTYVHATHRFGDNTLQDHINARSLEQLSSYCSRYKEHFGSASELKAADKCVTVWLH